MTESLPELLRRLAANPADRRCPDGQATRQAHQRLRLAEFSATNHLPTDLMQELTAAIDGVVDIVRGRT